MLSTRYIVFIEVAVHKSFSKAAQTLFISQPAISKHIQSLELHYKTKLFERSHNSIELTTAGKLLYEQLLQVKVLQDRIEFDLSSLSGHNDAKGFLKLGASTTIALYVLPKVLSGFSKQYPQLQISLLNRNSEAILEALLKKEINLGIVEETKGYPTIDTIPFISDEVIVVCSARNKLVKQKVYTVNDLPKFSIALRERGSGTLAAVKAALEQNHLNIKDLNVKLKLGGTEALKNFIIASDFIGFLPKRSVLRELRNQDLKEIAIENLHIERKFVFVKRKTEANSLTDQFIRFAKFTYNI